MPQLLSSMVRESLRRCVNTVPRIREKLAFGGDGQDSNFETAFASLAHTFLQEEAPTLLDYELGFELIDRNKEGDRAVGVTVCKVGKQTVMAPLFFLKGQLRGNELLWLADQNLFVPMKESWVNYIMNRAPHEVGKGVSKSDRKKYRMRQPDLSQLTQSPMKAASLRRDIDRFKELYATACVESLSEAAEKAAEAVNKNLNLYEFLKTAGVRDLRYLARLVKSNLKIATTFDRYVGLDVLSSLLHNAYDRGGNRSVLDTMGRAKNAAPSYRRGSLLPSPQDRVRQAITIKPRDKFAAAVDTSLPYAEYTLQDNRQPEDISRAFRLKLSQNLTNPTCSGVYETLVGPGEFATCAIINNPHTGNREMPGTSLVIELDGERRHKLMATVDIYVSPEPTEGGKLPHERFKPWFDGLSAPESVSPAEKEDTCGEPICETDRPHYAIITENGRGTVPFTVVDKNGDVWAVYPADFQNIATDFEQRRDERDRDFRLGSFVTDGNTTRLHLKGKPGTKMVSMDHDIYIPEGCKIVTLPKARNDAFVTRALDITRADLLSKTASLRLKFGGGTFNLNGGEIGQEPEARLHLIVGHGLSEDAANQLLKEARDSQTREASCQIKYASPWLANDDKTHVPFPDLDQIVGEIAGIQTSRPREEMRTVDDMAAVNGRSWESMSGDDYYPTPQSIAEVQQAASSGQKEVFDTTVLKQMLQSTDDSRLVDRNLPGMVAGMNSFGDQLFRFYAHQERFGDRYGTQDLPELEDGLRNAFEKAGDVVIFLKQKTIVSRPDIDMRDLDLDAAAADF